MLALCGRRGEESDCDIGSWGFSRVRVVRSE